MTKLSLNTAVTPNDNVYTSKKAEKLKNGDNIKGTRGRMGYVEKAIKYGDYKNIGYDIKEYRSEHPGCSCLELYTNLLYVKYKHIFGLPPKKIYNGQNILKVINADDFWRKCYFFNNTVVSEKERGKGVKFSRIRRITGYITGDMNTWGSAKKAEEKDRVKHI